MHSMRFRKMATTCCHSIVKESDSMRQTTTCHEEIKTLSIQSHYQLGTSRPPLVHGQGKGDHTSLDSLPRTRAGSGSDSKPSLEVIDEYIRN